MIRTSYWALAALFLLGSCGNSSRQPQKLDTSGLRVLSPSPDGVANSDRPTIRFTAVPNAARYRVSLWDETGGVLLEELIVLVPEVRFGTVLIDGAAYLIQFVAEFPNGSPMFTSERSRFRVVVTPEWMPEFAVPRLDAVQSQGGLTLFNVMDLRPPTIPERVAALALLNRAGEVVWWYEAGIVAIFTDARVLPNGNVLGLLSFADSNQLTTTAREIDWDGNVVWESPTDKLIHHEVGLGPGGNVLALTYEWQEVMPGVEFEGDGLVLWDKDTKDVLWTWNIFDHFPPAQWPTPESNDPGLSLRGRDWSHGNAAVWDPNRSLIWLSIRHFDNLVGVHYPSGDVQVIVGKGGLGGDGLLRHQHAPEIQADGSILVYDNGNGRTPEPYTRVVQLFVDDDFTEVREVFEWRDAPDFFDFAVGDADRLPNGNILITAGVSGRLIEITPAGEIVWELLMTNPAKPDRFWIYRAEHVEPSQVPASVLPFGR